MNPHCEQVRQFSNHSPTDASYSPFSPALFQTQRSAPNFTPIEKFKYTTVIRKELGRLMDFTSFLTKTEKDNIPIVILFPSSENYLRQLIRSFGKKWIIVSERKIDMGKIHGSQATGKKFSEQKTTESSVFNIVTGSSVEPSVLSDAIQQHLDFSCLVISDVNITEDTLDFQRELLEHLKPIYSLVKFDIIRETYSVNYLRGSLVRPVFGERGTESYILVGDEDKFTLREYVTSDYKRDCMYFQQFERGRLYSCNSSGGGPGFDSCFDCSSTVRIIEEYLRKHGDSEVEVEDVIQNLVEVQIGTHGP